MVNRVRVLGVHLVQAEEPAHLVEIEVTEPVTEFDFGEVTQEAPDLPRSNWQAANLEQGVGRGGGSVRLAFFFHYLDVAKPLLTAFGPVSRPPETPVPAHLQGIVYEPP